MYTVVNVSRCFENQIELRFCRLLWLASSSTASALSLSERFQQLVPDTRPRRITVTNLYADDAREVIVGGSRRRSVG